ncbi:MAG: HAMP domain-containing methyl-accepting chemotaxis protein [bacterium]
MKWFYNLKIRTKLLLSSLFMVVIAGSIGIVGFLNTTTLSKATNNIYSNEIQHSTRLQGLSTAFQRMHSDFILVVLGRTEEEKMVYAQKAEMRNGEMWRFASEIEQDLETPEEKQAFKKFRDAIDVLSVQRENVVDLVTSNKIKEAKELLYGGVEQTRQSMHEALMKLVDINLEASRSAAERAVANAGYAKLLITIVLATGIIVAIFLGFFIARTVSSPVNMVVRSIRNADLNTSFQSQRKDEVGDLMRAFDDFVLAIKNTLIKVMEAATAVASASAEISASTEQMAAGAQEQSTQATDVSSGVEQMTKTIYDNAKNAASTTDTANEAKQAAKQGGKVVKESIDAMRRIAHVVKESAETVRALGKSSNQIGEIVSVIDDIADQTNLLALNAAIEAARAGDQGRGFAVVADEVRRLAERTTKATKEIAEMIRKIQRDTSEAVHSMEKGTKEVDQGIKLADAAGNSLRSIVEISQVVTDKVAQIAAASEQQAGASEEISRNVEAISAVTQETASGIQQIARTADDMNKLTEALQQLIQNFKIHSAEDSAKVSPGVTSFNQEDNAQGYSGKSFLKGIFDQLKGKISKHVEREPA